MTGIIRDGWQEASPTVSLYSRGVRSMANEVVIETVSEWVVI